MTHPTRPSLLRRALTPQRPVHPDAPGAWAADLNQPVPMLSVLVLAVNDHILKGSGWLPGVITGKVSDIAGLFFFPLLLVAVVQGAQTLARLPHAWRIPRAALTASATLATGLVFTAVKLHPPTNALVARFWGVMVLDPTDLIALIMLIPAALWMRASAPHLPHAPS